MNWLIVAIFAYLILAATSLVDKYLLGSSIPNAKLYSFYVGALGLLAWFLAPLVGFQVPGLFQLGLSLAAGASFIYGLFWYYKGLKQFEASRIVPAIGGILPIFTLLLVFCFSRGAESLQPLGFLALFLLISGSVLITYQKRKKISLASFKLSLISAFFLALCFSLSKYVYLGQPFWSGFILIRTGGALMAGMFFLSGGISRSLFQPQIGFPNQKKTAAIFLSNQAAGAGANILENWAIALAPLAYIAFINALQGTEYVFLFILALLISVKFPQILKEEVSREVIFQKIISILLIGGGLIILAL